MMKRLVGATIVALLMMGGGTAAAGGSAIVVVPDTVEPGEEFAASNADGSECNGALVVGDFSARPGAWSVVPDDAGDWTVTLQVPPNGPPTAMGQPTPFPPGEYQVNAVCYFECPEGFEIQCGATEASALAASGAMGFAAFGNNQFTYDPATVTVVAAPEEPEPTTPTTEAPDDTTPDADVDDEAVEAPAAAPTTAQPTFTG